MRKGFIKFLFFVALFCTLFVITASAHSSEVSVNTGTLSLVVTDRGSEYNQYTLTNSGSGYQGVVKIPVPGVVLIRSGFEFTVSTTGIYYVSTNFLAEYPFDHQVKIYDTRDSSVVHEGFYDQYWLDSETMISRSKSVYLESGVTYRLWASAVDASDFDLSVSSPTSQIYFNYSITFDSATDDPNSSPVSNAPTTFDPFIQLRETDEQGLLVFRYYGHANPKMDAQEPEYANGSVTGSRDVVMASFQSNATSYTTTSTNYTRVHFNNNVRDVIAPVSGVYKCYVNLTLSSYRRSDGTSDVESRLIRIDGSNVYDIWNSTSNVVNEDILLFGPYSYFTGNPLKDFFPADTRAAFGFKFFRGTIATATAYIYFTCQPLDFNTVTNNYYINSGDIYNYGGNTYVTNNTVINNITYEGDTITNIYNPDNPGGGDGGGSGFNFWEWLADRIGSVFDTVIELLAQIISKVITALIDWILDLIDALLLLLSKIFAWFGNVFLAPKAFFDAIGDNSGLWEFYRVGG